MLMQEKLPRFISRFRKLYMWRFFYRCGVFVLLVLLYTFRRSQFRVMSGFGFFRSFSLLHLLWLQWIMDMVLQLVPCRSYWPLGSQKFLKTCFDPILGRISQEGLLEYIKKCNRDTLIIGAVWTGLTLIIGAFYLAGLLTEGLLLLISAGFYVCDLICVLFWCPFRVWLMKNRCCTTCRIFNWDHMMMFSPLFFVPGIFTWSLCLMALAVFFVWELTFAIHPERFWERTNGALRCDKCTDQLCGHRNCRVDIPELDNLTKKKI